MFRSVGFALALVLFVVTSAQCGAPAPLAAPEGAVLLTVSGRIGVTNVDGAAAFDRAALDALPQHAMTTGTAWTKGVSRFRGVPLRALLDRIGAPREGMLRLTALNDYTVEMPIEQITDVAPLLALDRDGSEMSVRDKGPIWLIYPYDSSPKWRSETMLSRSIWHLRLIEVLR